MKEGDLASVRQLLQHTGPNVPCGGTLLHVAADNNHTHVASFLLRFISPNAVNVAGYTPAHLAAMKGHTQVLSDLLRDPHLDASKRDPSGYTYKHWVRRGEPRPLVTNIYESLSSLRKHQHLLLVIINFLHIMMDIIYDSQTHT